MKGLINNSNFYIRAFLLYIIQSACGNIVLLSQRQIKHNGAVGLCIIVLNVFIFRIYLSSCNYMSELYCSRKFCLNSIYDFEHTGDRYFCGDM